MKSLDFGIGGAVSEVLRSNEMSCGERGGYKD